MKKLKELFHSLKEILSFVTARIFPVMIGLIVIALIISSVMLIAIDPNTKTNRLHTTSFTKQMSLQNKGR